MFPRGRGNATHTPKHMALAMGAIAHAPAMHTTMGPRGRHVLVGATFSFQSMYMHTVGDRAEAVQRMAIDATRLYQTIGTAIGVLDPKGVGGQGTAAAIREREAKGQPAAWLLWWQNSAAPLFAQWNTFKRDQIDGEGRDNWIGDYLSWTNRFSTDWSTYTDWAKRLDAIAKGAEMLGIIPKDTPGVGPLPTTAIEDVANTVRDAGHDLHTIAKRTLSLGEIAAYGILGIGGVVIVTSIVQNVRQGNDPVGRYVSYARGR